MFSIYTYLFAKIGRFSTPIVIIEKQHSIQPMSDSKSKFYFCSIFIFIFLCWWYSFVFHCSCIIEHHDEIGFTFFFQIYTFGIIPIYFKFVLKMNSIYYLSFFHQDYIEFYLMILIDDQLDYENVLVFDIWFVA